MEIVHYELGHGRVLCMLNEPLVTRNKTEVTCKRCLKKLKKSQPRARDITPHKMSVRHFVRGSDKKMKKSESIVLTVSDVKALISEAISECVTDPTLEAVEPLSKAD